MLWDGIIVAAALGGLNAWYWGHRALNDITAFILLWLGIVGIICWRFYAKNNRKIALALHEQFFFWGPDAAAEKIAQAIEEKGHSEYVEMWNKYKRYLPRSTAKETRKRI